MYLSSTHHSHREQYATYARMCHFAKRNIKHRNTERRAARGSTNQANSLAHDEIDETEILAHLEEIEKSWSERSDRCSQTVDECLKYARNSGLELLTS